MNRFRTLCVIWSTNQRLVTHLAGQQAEGPGEYQNGHYEEPGGEQCYGYQSPPEVAVVREHVDRPVAAVTDLPANRICLIDSSIRVGDAPYLRSHNRPCSPELLANRRKTDFSTSTRKKTVEAMITISTHVTTSIASVWKRNCMGGA